MSGWGLKTLAFTSSYAPLWLLLAIPAWKLHWAATAALVGLAVGSTAWILAALKAYGRMAPSDSVAPVSVVRRDADVVAYLFTYILPFVGLALDDVWQAASLGVFVVFLFLLYVKTNLLYVNPVMTIANYRIYEVELEKAPNKILITKERFIKTGAPVPVFRLSADDVYLQTQQSKVKS